MPKPLLPIVLTLLPSPAPHIVNYNASSRHVEGVQRQTHVDLQDGSCACSCPAYGTHYRKKAKEAGVERDIAHKAVLCPHLQAVLSELETQGCIKTVLVTAFSEFPLEVEW